MDVEARIAGLTRRVSADKVETGLEGVRTDIAGLRRDLPGIIAGTMREVLREGK